MFELDALGAEVTLGIHGERDARHEAGEGAYLQNGIRGGGGRIHKSLISCLVYEINWHSRKLSLWRQSQPKLSVAVEAT